MRSFIASLCCACASIFVCFSSANASVIVGPITNPANGHLYYLLSATNWTASEADAQTIGAHLVSINNAAENLFVYNTFSPDSVTGGVQHKLWLGLKRQAPHSSTFVWTNGDPVTYTNWASGEPNDNPAQGSVGEQFVEMGGPHTSGYVMLWNDNDNLGGGGAPEYGVAERVVPEPTSLAIALVSGCGMLNLRRRTQTAA